MILAVIGCSQSFDQCAIINVEKTYFALSFTLDACSDGAKNMKGVILRDDKKDGS